MQETTAYQDLRRTLERLYHLRGQAPENTAIAADCVLGELICNATSLLHDDLARIAQLLSTMEGDIRDRLSALEQAQVSIHDHLTGSIRVPETDDAPAYHDGP